VQTKREANLRRSPAYRQIDTAIQRARAHLSNNPDRRARSALLDTLAGLEKAMRQTPVYDARHHTKWDTSGTLMTVSSSSTALNKRPET